MNILKIFLYIVAIGLVSLGVGLIIQSIVDARLEKDMIKDQQLNNATIYGYLSAQNDYNNQWTNDILKFGYTYQNIFYKNETYTMKCEVVQ